MSFDSIICLIRTLCRCIEINLNTTISASREPKVRTPGHSTPSAQKGQTKVRGATGMATMCATTSAAYVNEHLQAVMTVGTMAVWVEMDRKSGKRSTKNGSEFSKLCSSNRMETSFVCLINTLNLHFRS